MGSRARRRARSAAVSSRRTPPSCTRCPSEPAPSRDRLGAPSGSLGEGIPRFRRKARRRRRVLRSRVMARMPRRVALGVLLSTILSALGLAVAEGRRPALPSRAEQDFIDRHLRRPLAPQGEPPDSFSPAERSLLPESCGGCHPAQFADWSLSLHGKSMCPGIASQL